MNINNKIISFFSILLLLITGSMSAHAVETSTTIIKPLVISTSQPDLINPLRGLYKWRGQESATLNSPALDIYDRITWRSLEPQKDQYDFSIIERGAVEAKNRNGKYSFVVRSLYDTQYIAFPDYMRVLMPKAWQSNLTANDGKKTIVPDWNDVDYADRLNRLFQALANRYNNDPRIGFVENGLYGRWGEWHMSGYTYPAPNGALKATLDTMKKLVDVQLNNFTNKRNIMMSDNLDALKYALSRSPKVGIGRMSLGNAHFEKPFLLNDPIINNRWKTAPIIVEFMNPRNHLDPVTYQIAATQVTKWHVAMNGNGNSIPWSVLSTSGKTAFLNIGKNSGYRFITEEVSFLKTVSSNRTLAVNSKWRNVGVTPAYNPWNVTYQLRNKTTNVIAWKGISKLNLESVVSLPLATSTSFNDSFILPETLARGTYSLELIVEDKDKYYKPLQLAIQGKTTNGSYLLGDVLVPSFQ